MLLFFTLFTFPSFNDIKKKKKKEFTIQQIAKIRVTSCRGGQWKKYYFNLLIVSPPKNLC